MNTQDCHAMELQSCFEGVQTWHCPICGRRIAFTTNPSRMIEIEPGDRAATHSGSTGGLRMVGIRAESELPQVWQDAINKLEFD